MTEFPSKLRSSQDFLLFIEEFAKEIRTTVPFVRPEDVSSVLQIIAERYDSWLTTREEHILTAPGNVVFLRRGHRENHRNDEEESEGEGHDSDQ